MYFIWLGCMPGFYVYQKKVKSYSDLCTSQCGILHVVWELHGVYIYMYVHVIKVWSFKVLSWEYLFVCEILSTRKYGLKYVYMYNIYHALELLK